MASPTFFKSDGDFSYLQIEPRPAAIACYSGTTAMLTSDAQFPLTELYDALGNFASNGFVTPAAGLYFVEAAVETNSQTWGASDFLSLSIFASGAVVRRERFYVSGTYTNSLSLSIKGLIQLNANVTVDSYVKYTASSATPSFNGVTFANYFSIFFVGKT